jgi:TPR repeat protein
LPPEETLEGRKNEIKARVLVEKNMPLVHFATVFAGLLLASVASAESAMQRGLQAWSAQQPADAIEHWRPLAESGDAQAQLYLAYAYRRGRGVIQDDALAARWYRRAAEQGLPDAQYQLGVMYELGLGLAADQAEADYWYGRAVAQGFCPGELSAGGRLGD